MEPIFNQFFDLISTRYSVPREKVVEVCLRGKVIRPKPRELDKKSQALFEQARDMVAADFPSMKMTLDKLKKICQSKGLKTTGKKEVLLDRLEHPNNPEHLAKYRGKKKGQFKGRNVEHIIEKLQGPLATLPIVKSNGQYIHEETGLVFDPNTLKACGRLCDGQLRWLTPHDIHLCQKLRVRYELPENLDLGDVRIRDKVVEEVLGDEDFKDESEESGDEEGDESGDDN